MTAHSPINRNLDLEEPVMSLTPGAVLSLQMLGATPENTEPCINQVQNLQNDDGGYGDRAFWRSNPVATFYALETLATLKASPSAPRPKRVITTRKSPGADLQVIPSKSKLTAMAALPMRWK